MKIIKLSASQYRLIAMVGLTILIILAGACSTPLTNTTNPPEETTTAPLETRDLLVAPTIGELVEGRFMHPEIPRVTAEKLKKMMDDEGKLTGEAGTVFWDNFALVDVQSVDGYTTSHLPGAINLPYTHFWVTDPREDPKPEEVDAWEREKDSFERNLLTLPKGTLIIFYGSTADDEPAALAAQALVGLNIGYTLDDVGVLWKGYWNWYFSGFPCKGGDYYRPGEDEG